MNPLAHWSRGRAARRCAAQERLARTAGYARGQRIEALRAFLRDPERARRARADAPEGDDRLLYLRVQSALRRLEREAQRAAARAERERSALRNVHGAPRLSPLAASTVQIAASQLMAVLRPTAPDQPACT